MLTLLLLAFSPLGFAQSPALNAPSPTAADKPSSTELPPPPSAAAADARTSAGTHTATEPQPAAAPAAAKQHPKPINPKRAQGSDDLATALERPGDLNLHGLSLDAALFTISEQWNINIVAGDLKGTVNGVFKQAPLREILDAILLSNGYNYRQVGKSLVISSIDQLGEINPFFQSAVIPVPTADIDEVVQGAQLLKTPKGEVRPLKSAHSIVVVDFPDRVKMIRDFVHTLDTAGSGRLASGQSRNGMRLDVGLFRTEHISAKTAEQALQGVLSKSGKVTIMEKEDRLLVTDYPDNLAMVEKVLTNIDRPRPQVRITALIYDLSLRDIEDLGINWNHAIKTNINSDGDAQGKLAVDSLMEVPFQAGTAGSTLTFMNLSRHFDITAVAVALQGASDSRLLADPNVAVLENEEAVIKKVSEIPYQQLTQTQQGGNIGTTAFKEAGITLTVTPKIASDGTIRMIVHPEVSRLTGFTPGDNQPIIDTSSTTTVLSVANRQTVVIGGLRQRSDVGDFNGVPYLKDLNVIGRLFRARNTDVRESELVVFLSPEIIGYADEPNCRQKLVDDTIRCRLDQIPEAEGCPPCCRRLPIQPGEEILPAPAADHEPTVDGPSPAAGTSGTPANEGLNSTDADGRSEQFRNMATDGRLRRLPTVLPVKTSVASTTSPRNNVFPAPPAEPPTIGSCDDDRLRTADPFDDPSLRR